MKSIKTKIIFSFSLIILLAGVALGMIAINGASKAVKGEAEKGLVALSHDGAKLTKTRVEQQMKTLEIISAMPDIESMDWELQKIILQKQLEHTGFQTMAIVALDGKAIYLDGATADLAEREYIKKALTGETNVSDIIISKVTNSLVLMYATPIKNDGKIVGVLIGRKDGNALSEITDDIQYGKNGYAYMINDKGIVVAHKDRKMVFDQFNPLEKSKTDKSIISLARLFEKILKEKQGISNYNYKGNDNYAGYTAIEGTNWTLVITANVDEVLASIPKMRNAVIVSTAIILFIVIVITYFIGNSISKPIILSVQHANKIASLDLTQDVPEVFLKKKDEIGLLAKGLKTLTDNLRQIVHEVDQSAEQVSATSEELSATTQQSAFTIEEVTKAAVEIAGGAADQAKNTEIGSSKAMLLGDIIEKDIEDVMNLTLSSKKVTVAVNEGLIDIENLYKITLESNSASKEIYDVVLKTNESSDRIGQASNVIASIAAQTNLLALNAAIEAARAGDAGRGFAVVASEIGKLAEQSALSIKDIDEIVNELQKNVEDAVKTMERVSTIAIEQTNSVKKNKEKYVIISDAMAEAAGAVSELNEATNEMTNMKGDILDTLQNLSAIAQENSAATEEMTASMEEQSASMEQIASATEDLSTLALDLQSIIRRFEI